MITSNVARVKFGYRDRNRASAMMAITSDVAGVKWGIGLRYAHTDRPTAWYFR